MAPWRAFLAQALLLLGEADEARALADEHAALARGWGAAPTVARRCASMGWPPATSSRFASRSRWREAHRPGSSSRCHSSSSAPPSVARTAAPSRASFSRRGSRSLTAAGPAGSRSGRSPSCSRPAPALAAAPASGRDALTPSELRVAEMAATGQTNREVAQRLFVTQKTVEAHLARAFRKLGIDSRVQLASALARSA